MFTQEVADKVCEGLTNGLSLRKSCEQAGTTHPTFLRWTEENKDLADQYTRARTIGWALLADEVLTISDDSTGDTYEDADGNVKTDHEVVARSRLRVDSRKWMLSKMLPKVYGDKVELGGKDGGPIQVVINKLA